ncbi:glutamate--cysteine ligase [Rubrobacter taiwanensis]|jgi:carboxylate-amine ligase|uniref:Putative glutamate--cysteine ligase 2 n=1 Tax=Rubrobacter taiwanensis TaxID=185139 RepID=A0A4V2NX84_9ACTN|nr:glutamate--cysteine ligase [Rubrobacter taiwanensis]TCJ20272.1 glutamate--cysteine ligase [Rubrobacter taiwanensis]
METNFDASARYTVGVEEEFQLVDPGTLGLAPAIDSLLAARDTVGLPGDSLASELFSSCLEVRSPVCSTLGELAAELAALRRRARELAESCGVRLAAAGAHPFSEAVDQPLTGGERYRRVEEKMGWAARMQAIYGLHVHVAVPDEERAILGVGALARYIPLFLALSANSPFWGGRDTRLASVRIKVFDLFPRSGVPPAFSCWEDFERHVAVLTEAGSVPDYTWCWWDVRPHPRLGTVELRAPDAQTELDRTVSLAALARCIVATAGEHPPPESPVLLQENKWRATRHGLDARFYDFTAGRSIAAREAVRELVRRLRPVAQDLGCEEELAGVLEIVRDGSGSERQRAVLKKRGSLEAVVEYLISATA